MNLQERELFWQTLCSLKGENPQEDIRQLIGKIKTPKYLYRYRDVNMNTLEALRTNRLYFSTANYYDDPFDTFLHIDIEAIKKEYLKSFENKENAEIIVEKTKALLRNVLTEEQLGNFTLEKILEAQQHGLTENFVGAALALRDELKKDTWSVCFSENGFNENLWLKYADKHKGFALMYDMENDENFLCGKQEKCKNCGIKNFGTPLYPIHYSNVPYDATEIAKRVMLHKVGELAGVEIPEELYQGMCNVFWERERIALIKKECHKYDEEWRIIANCAMKPPVMMEWIPSGIILGLRMDKAEENIVISMAREAGIKKIYKSYINLKNELDAFSVNIIQ